MRRHFLSLSSSPLGAAPLRVALLNLMPAKRTAYRQIHGLLELTGQPFELSQYRVCQPEEAELQHPDWQVAQALPTTRALMASAPDFLIINGAPVGQKRFEDVSFMPELAAVYDWSRLHVRSTLNICWAAVAALHHFRGVTRQLAVHKFSGVYYPQVSDPHDALMVQMPAHYPVPVSRYSFVTPDQLHDVRGVQVLSADTHSGVALARDGANRQILSFNHPEYEADTLAREYQRDCAAGRHPDLPVNYFMQHDPSQAPAQPFWQQAARSLVTNWLAEGQHVPVMRPRAVLLSLAS